MAILLGITQWDAGTLARAAAAPGAGPRHPGLAADRRSRRRSRYAAVWKQPPGVLATLPNLRGIVSLGAGVDHLFADPDLPDVPIARVVDADLTSADERMGGAACPDASAPPAALRPIPAALRVERRPPGAVGTRRARRHHGNGRARPGRGTQACHDGVRRRRLEPAPVARCAGIATLWRGRSSMPSWRAPTSSSPCCR